MKTGLKNDKEKDIRKKSPTTLWLKSRCYEMNSTNWIGYQNDQIFNINVMWSAAVVTLWLLLLLVSGCFGCRCCSCWCCCWLGVVWWWKENEFFYPFFFEFLNKFFRENFCPKRDWTYVNAWERDAENDIKIIIF